MSLLVTEVHGEPKTDDFGNVSYWVSIEGIDGNVLVSHSPNKPALKAGDDAAASGWEGVEEKTSKKGSTYKKLRRPQYQGRQDDPKKAAVGSNESIERQVAAKEATQILRLAHDSGKPAKDVLAAYLMVFEKVAAAISKDAA